MRAESAVRGFEELEQECRTVSVENDAEVEELLEEIHLALRSAVITRDQDLTLAEILSDRM